MHIVRLARSFKNFDFEPNEDNIQSAFNELDKVLKKINTDFSREVLIEYYGWLSKSSNFKILKKDIEKLNLDYKVTIRRHFRKDLFRNFTQHGLFPGFRIKFKPRSFISPELRTPIVCATKNLQNLVLPLGSNANSSYVIDHFSFQYESMRYVNKANPGYFYLDIARLEGQYLKNPVQSWIYRNLDKVIDLLRYVDSPELTTTIIELMPESSISIRNLDRINFLLKGENAKFKSDLVPLRVDKTLSKLLIFEDQPFVKTSRNHAIVDFEKTTRSLKVPKTGFHLVREVLLVEGCQVIKDGTLILIEEAADPSRDFVSGQWSYLFSGRVQANSVLMDRARKSIENIQSGILIGGRNETNWYHWVIEYVSRLAFDSEIPDDVPILVSENIPAAFHDLIRRVTNRQIVTLSTKNDWSIDYLYVAQPLMQILDSTVIPWDQGISSNFEALNSYREKVIYGLSRTNTPKKIFLNRVSGHRGVINQKELTEIAIRHGYTCLDPSKLKLIEQLELFQNAETVVGPSGAVMANYLFASSNCKIVALTNEHLHNFVLPGLLASYAGAKFQYLLGKPVSKKFRTSNEKMHSDFIISKNKFEKVLASLETHTTLNR